MSVDAYVDRFEMLMDWEREREEPKSWQPPTFPPVLTKADGSQRYLAGDFGNRSPSWTDSLAFEEEADGNALYHLRNGNQAGGATYYDLSYWGTIARWRWLRNQGLEQGYYCSQMCPTEKTILQGEVQQAFPGSGRCGLDLYYSTTAKPMREALRLNGQQESGIIAVSLLKRHLRPGDYEWLLALLERYPGHVIEFTTLSCCWGTVPNSNTLIWEVRLY